LNIWTEFFLISDWTFVASEFKIFITVFLRRRLRYTRKFSDPENLHFRAERRRGVNKWAQQGTSFMSIPLDKSFIMLRKVKFKGLRVHSCGPRTVLSKLTRPLHERSRKRWAHLSKRYFAKRRTLFHFSEKMDDSVGRPISSATSGLSRLVPTPPDPSLQTQHFRRRAAAAVTTYANPRGSRATLKTGQRNHAFY